jgi:hypothetical protein
MFKSILKFFMCTLKFHSVDVYVGNVFYKDNYRVVAFKCPWCNERKLKWFNLNHNKD